MLRGYPPGWRFSPSIRAGVNGSQQSASQLSGGGSRKRRLMSASGQKQTFRHLKTMSALPPKADIGTQSRNVRFVPKADICGAANRAYSINSSARARKVVGRLRPSTSAVVKLTARSNLVGCSTGISAGFAPRRTLSTKSAVRRYRSGKFAP